MLSERHQDQLVDLPCMHCKGTGYLPCECKTSGMGNVHCLLRCERGRISCDCDHGVYAALNLFEPTDFIFHDAEPTEAELFELIEFYGLIDNEWTRICLRLIDKLLLQYAFTDDYWVMRDRLSGFRVSLLQPAPKDDL